MERTVALLIAEAPTRDEAELERKIEIYETMSPLPGDLERSRTAYMTEIAMYGDASRLGIALRKAPYDAASGSVQSDLGAEIDALPRGDD